MLDDHSRSDTIPAMDIRCKHVDVGHEATIGRIGDDKVFYLMSRGIPEEEARHDDRERLRRPGLEGAPPRIRRGNEQPHQA